MKKTTEPLIDDLLADAISPEFRTALLDKTLHSARQRKRARRLNLTLSALALAGLFAFEIQAVRNPGTLPQQIRQPVSSAAALPAPPSLRVVSTKLDSFKSVAVLDSSDSTLTVIQTGESARPREISDRELLALAAGQPVALIHQGLHQSELFFPGNW